MKRYNLLWNVFLLLTAVALTLGTGVGRATAQAVLGDTLGVNSSLYTNQALLSANKKFEVVLQGDQNLVLYDLFAHNGSANAAPRALWATNTVNRAGSRLSLQNDGNLVLYTGAGRAVWASNTRGKSSAYLRIQNDGNLVLYTGAGRAVWATGTWQRTIVVRVPNFWPSKNGLHFDNAWPSVPLAYIHLPAPLPSIPIGDASNGMCGGMTYAVRDWYQSGLLPPSDTTAPSHGPLFDYVASRLIDSFGLPFGPLEYYGLMDPYLPDHETWASKAGFTPHGRAWIMINREWPKIESDLNNGILSPLGLVRVKTFDPFQLGQNHQVLAYGYDLYQNDLTIHLYDPDAPNDDNVTLSLNMGDPDHTTPLTYAFGWGAYPRDTTNCFFRTDYSYAPPFGGISENH